MTRYHCFLNGAGTGGGWTRCQSPGPMLEVVPVHYSQEPIRLNVLPGNGLPKKK